MGKWISLILVVIVVTLVIVAIAKHSEAHTSPDYTAIAIAREREETARTIALERERSYTERVQAFWGFLAGVQALAVVGVIGVCSTGLVLGVLVFGTKLNTSNPQPYQIYFNESEQKK